MVVWIRAQVARAAREMAPMWPLHSFIAVNPLMDFESKPFESAAAPGLTLTKSRASYRQDLEAGRITASDLGAALSERVPEFAGDAYIEIAGERMRALDLLVSELLIRPADGEAEASGPVPERSRSDQIDDLSSKWLSAFLDPDPLWPMPHRAAGLYAAWRTLARHDPDLTKRARRGVLTLPAAADEALVRALELLGVPKNAVVDVFRAELGGLPGWASHLKWRAEHVGDIDLVEYLALRLSARVVLGLAVPQTEPQLGQSTEQDALW